MRKNQKFQIERISFIFHSIKVEFKIKKKKQFINLFEKKEDNISFRVYTKRKLKNRNEEFWNAIKISKNKI